MARTLSTQNAAEVTNTITRPWYLLTLNFATVLRLTNIRTVTYDANSYTGANLNIAIDGDKAAAFQLFNETNSYASTFKDEVNNGITATIDVLYGDPADWVANDHDRFFSGEIGSCSIAGDQIDCVLIPAQPKMTPWLYYTNQYFSALPLKGAKIRTRNGIVPLERG